MTTIRAAGLLALRTVAEAYGGLVPLPPKQASAANRCIAPSPPKGNLTLKTLLAVLKAVGMKLSVEPENQVVA